MQELFVFIYKRRAFFSFILLELLALWLVFNQNSYQHFAYLSTSNRLSAEIFDATSSTQSYFDLASRNDSLAKENALLRNELSNSQNGYGSVPGKITYQHIAARAINNSVSFVNNYLTIDRGSLDGLQPGMGVMGTNGVVGKVKACSKHFSTVYSVLHANMPISSQLKKNKHLCTTKWEGYDYTEASLLNLPMHVVVEVGDTVVTSGHNAVFPPEAAIGIVSHVEKRPDEIFQTVRLKLSTDFANLDHVYVVKNIYLSEKDSLEKTSTPDAGLKPEDLK
jgi:rod shape-determining protein MreC